MTSLIQQAVQIHPALVNSQKLRTKWYEQAGELEVELPRLERQHQRTANPNYRYLWRFSNCQHHKQRPGDLKIIPQSSLLAGKNTVQLF